MRVAIIGAGISGLATAFYLKRARPDAELAIYDPGVIAGGSLQTVDVQGFRFEAGGNGFLTNKPDCLQLVQDSGGSHLLMPSAALARRRFIYDGRLQPHAGVAAAVRQVATADLAAETARAWRVLRAGAARRRGREPARVWQPASRQRLHERVPGCDGGRNLRLDAGQDLGARGLPVDRGPGARIRRIVPRHAGKAQAGSGSRRCADEHRARHQQHDRAFARRDAARMAPRRAGYECRRGTARASVSKVRIGSADYDQVVVAAPSYVAAGLLRELDPVLARMLGAIDYSPIAVVGFGYRTLQHPLDGFGLLTTTAARAPVLGVLWDSSIFPDRAPAGCKSLRSMIGGQRSPELVDQDDAGLIRTALQGLDQTMGVRDAPDVTFVKRWERGYPELRARPRRTSGRDLRQACGASRAALELQCVPGNRHERLRAQWARTGSAHRPLTERLTTRYRSPRRGCSSRPRTCRARGRSGSR